MLTGQLEAMRDFYRDVLGMGVTDYLGTEGVWLHINADHHVMALVGKTPAHFHHFALDLVDWGTLRVAFDHLGQHGRWLGWGPVRHALGQNLCGYVRIPEEHLFVELYCDMEVLDLPHTAREWRDDPRGSNLWGILPPRSYFRFDEAAVESGAPPARGARHAAAAALVRSARARATGGAGDHRDDAPSATRM